MYSTAKLPLKEPTEMQRLFLTSAHANDMIYFG